MADLSIVISSQETFIVEDQSIPAIYEIDTIGTIDASSVVVIEQFLFSSQLINDSAPSSTRTYSSVLIEALLNAKQGSLTFDLVPTDASTNPVQSNGIFDALALKSDTSHSHMLDALTDVTAPTPTIGDTLSWNGTAWVNSVPSAGVSIQYGLLNAQINQNGGSF